MRMAYHWAWPFAAGIGSVTLVASTLNEIRYYRQSKTLHGIARASHSRAS